MKKSLLLLVALACTGAVAQEKEIWACQQVEGTLLNWEGGSWKQYLKVAEPLLLTIDGANSNSKQGETESSLDCSIVSPAFPKVSCLSRSRTLAAIFDPETGKLGVSMLMGAVMTGNIRDSVTAEIYSCTKF